MQDPETRDSEIRDSGLVNRQTWRLFAIRTIHNSKGRLETMGTLAQMLADLEEQETLAQVQDRLGAGDDPLAILEECREGMALIGQRFESGEYYLSDLIMAGEIFKQAGNAVAPHLAGGQAAAPKGVIVIGTVHGDIHDIGKDIVVTMLRSANYQVEDLGVDVPVDSFVQRARKTGAGIVGLSGLLTISFDPMKETVAALKAAGLAVKVMIGGGPVTEQVLAYTGADAMGLDAQAAVALANGWTAAGGVA
jgi:5-methyltetrahydrofolate--homocysteine methyltransferase